MIKEKSCGAVVYTFENGELLILAEYMQAGHISIPKGHVESGESEEKTALREIAEETGLVCELDTAFRKVISYSPYDGCVKDVVFFVARAVGGEMVNQECEVRALRWMSVRDILAALTHESDRQTVKEAAEYIAAKYR